MVELKSSTNKIWEALRNSTTLFPKAMPHRYKSIEVLKGDGQSEGSIRLVKLKSENNFNWKTMVSSKGDGSMVKWSCNYDKANEYFPNSDIIKEFTFKKFQELDAYLIKSM
ncbi:MLP-like protein 423 [Andrographis paniculata]|uniref:MLP-like protein 423 n=1 Tax=Andrographis paniculata TaxID=175694 RepID=UPI0021E91E6C|nr:MLP-like protein 423 [Andrographis paniculata]